MSVQLALRFDEVPITCETRAAISFDFRLPDREAIGGRTGGRARALLQHRLPLATAISGRGHARTILGDSISTRTTNPGTCHYYFDL